MNKHFSAVSGVLSSDLLSLACGLINFFFFSLFRCLSFSLVEGLSWHESTFRDYGGGVVSSIVSSSIATASNTLD